MTIGDVVATYYALRAGSFPRQTPPNMVVEAFQDASGIDTVNSSNYATTFSNIYGSFTKGIVVPTRSNGATYLNKDPFNSTSGFTIATTGNASVAINSGKLQLSSGSGLGNTCYAYQNMANCPVNFGVRIISSLSNVGTNTNDAQIIHVGNLVDGRSLSLRITNNKVEFSDGTSYQNLPNLPAGTGLNEYLFQMTDVGGGNYGIGAYCNNRLVNSYSGISVPVNVSGQVLLQQASGSNTGRTSEIATITVGSSVLSDNMVLQGKSYTNRSTGSTAKLYVIAEVDANDFTINSDIVGKIDVNGGGFTTVSLTSGATQRLSRGLINTNNEIRIFEGTLAGSVAINDVLTPQILTANGKLLSINGYAIDVV